MPSIQSPTGALPSRFRRQRILIIGCGDVGLRVAHLMVPRVRVMALTSSPARIPALRALGIVPLQGNLDAPQTLRRLAGLATRLVHLAPPPHHSTVDRRTGALLAVLRCRSGPKALVYGSTSGVYGDCEGQRVTETRVPKPQSARGQRRLDAEAHVRHWGRTCGVASILRIPGIYAPDRVGGTPHARLVKGSPVLQQDEDVFTNHIHADDLARACALALWRGAPQRIYNINDDTDLKMGDYFDLAAKIFGLPLPQRVSRHQASTLFSEMQLSFMAESRRLVNTRMQRELRLRLDYPTVNQGLVGVSPSPVGVGGPEHPAQSGSAGTGPSTPAN